jgi:hypothetical protein
MENKIYNQDCLDVMREMNNESIDLLLTDIPYGGVNRKSNGLRNLDKKRCRCVYNGYADTG